MSGLSWGWSRHFPYRDNARPIYKHKALIGVGGNLGDTVERFERLFAYWRQSSRLAIIECSPILKNPPFGYLNQPDFYNATMLISTMLSPHELLRYMLYTEKRFGRVRSFADAPRTLDLDLIFYDNITLKTRRLSLPHPSWDERDSVVMPLQQMKGKYNDRRDFYGTYA